MRYQPHMAVGAMPVYMAHGDAYMHDQRYMCPPSPGPGMDGPPQHMYGQHMYAPPRPPPPPQYQPMMAQRPPMPSHPRQMGMHEAPQRCARVYEAMKAKGGVHLVASSPSPGMPGLEHIGARLYGEPSAAPYTHLPDEFIADMRMLWMQHRARNDDASNLGQLARLMQAAFERLARQWVIGDTATGRPPLPIEIVATADDHMCSECGSRAHDERMALCQICDRVVHIDCLRPQLGSVPEVRAACSARAARVPARARAAGRASGGPSVPAGSERRGAQHAVRGGST